MWREGRAGWQEIKEECLSCFVFLGNFFGRVPSHWELCKEDWLPSSRTFLSNGGTQIHFPVPLPDNGMVKCYSWSVALAKIGAASLDVAYQRHHFFFQSLIQFVYGLWSPLLGKSLRLLHASISSSAKWEHVLDAEMCDLLMFDMMLSSTKSVFQSHTIEFKKITKISHNVSVGKSACLMIWVQSLEPV